MTDQAPPKPLIDFARRDDRHILHKPAFDDDAPLTRCDRCLALLGGVIVFAPIVLFWVERYLAAAGVR